MVSLDHNELKPEPNTELFDYDKPAYKLIVI